MRLMLALRAFFRVLFDTSTAERLRPLLLEGPSAEKPAEKPTPAPAPAPAAPPKTQRSDALTLLAALQREARFVDFLKEPLDGFSDAQVGAVARDVHRECGKVVERWFGIVPITDQEEGSTLELPEGYDPNRYRVVGQTASGAPIRGRLVHHGWEATRVETPVWTGSADSARVIAPVEVEA